MHLSDFIYRKRTEEIPHILIIQRLKTVGQNQVFLASSGDVSADIRSEFGQVYFTI